VTTLVGTEKVVVRPDLRYRRPPFSVRMSGPRDVTVIGFDPRNVAGAFATIGEGERARDGLGHVMELSGDFSCHELNFPVSGQKTARPARNSPAQRGFAPLAARSASLAQRLASRSTWSWVARSCAASAKFRQSKANPRYFAAASLGASLAAFQGLPAIVRWPNSPHANDCHCDQLSMESRSPRFDDRAVQSTTTQPPP
jgi:hypothetical protein